VARIEIIGVPGAGKSTLARQLAHLGLALLHEDYRANPFWPSHLRAEVAKLGMELTFLLQHLDQIKATTEGPLPLICDYSLLTDKAFAMARLNDDMAGLYLRVYDHLINSVEPATAYVAVLPTTADVHRQMRQRARPEERDFTELEIAKLGLAVTSLVSDLEKRGSGPIIRTGEREPQAIEAELRLILKATR